jgi:hypothetical protein
MSPSTTAIRKGLRPHQTNLQVSDTIGVDPRTNAGDCKQPRPMADAHQLPAEVVCLARRLIAIK